MGGYILFFFKTFYYIYFSFCLFLEFIYLRLMLVERPPVGNDTLSDSSGAGGYCTSLWSATMDVGGAFHR